MLSRAHSSLWVFAVAKLVEHSLGADSPFVSTSVLALTTSRFPSVSGGFLERRIPGKNGNGKYPYSRRCIDYTHTE